MIGDNFQNLKSEINEKGLNFRSYKINDSLNENDNIVFDKYLNLAI